MLGTPSTTQIGEYEERCMLQGQIPSGLVLPSSSIRDKDERRDSEGGEWRGKPSRSFISQS